MTNTQELTLNEAYGSAYLSNAETALVQYAFTGTMSNIFYMSSRTQINELLELCKQCSPEFIVKVAIASRKNGYMKDTPAMLAAYLNHCDRILLSQSFDRIINNGKMLKKFVQFVRSGVTGTPGFGSVTKASIRQWLNHRNDHQLMCDNIGGKQSKTGSVSLADIIKMVHPIPKSPSRSAMYAWILKGTVDKDNLPLNVLEWEEYKTNIDQRKKPPKVPFEMLEGVDGLTVQDWEQITYNMSWQQLRQNLELLNRRDIFKNPHMVRYVCKRLTDKEEIHSAHCFPYQILVAYLNSGTSPEGFGWTSRYWQAHGKGKVADKITLPKEIRSALESAMETAIGNVPNLPGQVFVCPDTSGSMGYPITGQQSLWRDSPSSKVRCVDVAGLITAAILRKNPTAISLPFNTEVHKVNLSVMGSVMSNAAKFAELGGGGTSCSAPLRLLNKQKSIGDVVILISDYESWADPNRSKQTAMMVEWDIFKNRNPKAKLICIDLIPRTNHQVSHGEDILQIGGFSDNVFSIIRAFVTNQLYGKHWVNVINEVQI